MKKKRITILVLSLILLLGLVGCSNGDSTKSYNLTVVPKEEENGEVTVEPQKDSYEEGTEVSITASGKGDYSFDYWEGSGYDENTNNPLTIPMMSDVNLVAVFADAAAPTWTSDPQITTAVDKGSVGISAEIDEAGTIYHKVMSDGATKPTASEVKSAENSISMSADSTKEITIESLDEGTEYDIFFVAEDDKENLQSNDAVKKVDVNTEEANQEPVIDSITNVSDGEASVTEGEELSLPVSASDEDGDDLTYDISGTDADKFSQSGDTFTWTPPFDDYSTDDTFKVTLKVSDGTATVTADVEIKVNDDTTAPSPPTIEGVSSGTYNTDQSFTISGEDEAEIEYSTDGGSSWNEYSSEVTLSEEGNYNLVARQTDEAGNTSSTTDEITVTIDTGPDWTTDPSITTSADTSSVGISAEIDEAGTIYYKVMSDGATKPTAGEVKSAENGISMSADSTKEITIDSLNEGTEYDIFFVAEDSAGNLQSDSIVKKVDVSTQLSEPHDSSFENIPAGTTSSDNGEITLDYHIEMGKYEVTHAEFIEFLNSAGVASEGNYEEKKVIDMDDSNCAVAHDGNSFHFASSNVAKSEDTPVTTITWYGAVAYCNWLSEQEGLNSAYDLDNWELKDSDESTLEGYRLPTETEWEYAARGGANGDNTTYAGSDDIGDVAWYDANCGGETHPVGEKEANELGIYDMSGNVYEWTNDVINASDRVGRGGGWNDNAGDCKMDSWKYNNPSNSYYGLGFRLTKTK